MCGIYGWDLQRAPVSRKQRLVLGTVLALLNDNRGGDSWGFHAPQDGETRRGMDDMVPAAHLVSQFEVVGCHTRKATVGAKTIQNAHPFEIGNLIGAHNGGIWNHSEMSKKYSRSFEVDSMHIFAHLSEGKEFGELEGYGAVWWLDKGNPKEIFICKISTGADLSIHGLGKPGESTGLIWSSDSRHLNKAIQAAGIETFPYDVKAHEVYAIRDGVLYITERKLEFKGFSSSSKSGVYTGYTGHSWWKEMDDDDRPTFSSRIMFGRIRVSAKDGVEVYDGPTWLTADEFLKKYPNSRCVEDVKDVIELVKKGISINNEDLDAAFETRWGPRCIQQRLDDAKKERLLDEKKKNTVVSLHKEEKTKSVLLAGKEMSLKLPTQEEFEGMSDAEQEAFLEKLNLSAVEADMV